MENSRHRPGTGASEGSTGSSRYSRSGNKSSNSFGVLGQSSGRRSVSPTQYYQSKINRFSFLETNLENLNIFIYNGIEKFLDKKAVHDLINDYDHDAWFNDVVLERDFVLLKTNSKDSDNYLNDDYDNDEKDYTTRNMLQVKQEKIQELDQNHLLNSLIERPTSSRTIMDTFRALTRIKLFNIRNNKGQRLRKSANINNGAVVSTRISCFG